MYNLEREENIVCQRKPLDNKIHAQIITQAKEADVNSREASLADVVSGSKATGWWNSEHSQTKLSIVDYNEYPNKKLVMKAINILDVIFSDKNGKYFR